MVIISLLRFMFCCWQIEFPLWPGKIPVKMFKSCLKALAAEQSTEYELKPKQTRLMLGRDDKQRFLSLLRVQLARQVSRRPLFAGKMN